MSEWFKEYKRKHLIKKLLVIHEEVEEVKTSKLLFIQNWKSF